VARLTKSRMPNAFSTNTVWQTLTNITLASESAKVVDPGNTGASSRFYRATYINGP